MNSNLIGDFHDKLILHTNSHGIHMIMSKVHITSKNLSKDLQEI